jgi:hypothetical protein
MKHYFYHILFGAVFVSLAVLFACCSPHSARAKRADIHRHGDDTSRSKHGIIAIILSIPEYAYHEDSRESFIIQLLNAHSLPQNHRTADNYLYIPGDGVCPEREFIWDKKSEELLIRMDKEEDREEGRKGVKEVDRWKCIEGKWQRQ